MPEDKIMRYSILLMTVAVAIGLGCAQGGGNPVAPNAVAQSAVASPSTHYLWGMWRIVADPVAGTLDIVPLRTESFHANVIPFLEPPAGLKLKISNLVFDGDICDVDVSLTHPFPGMSQYTGFDVCGILISNGSWTGFHDAALTMAGPGDTRLLNADGFTRWWNPLEFPQDGTILRYKDGLLGIKDSVAHYNCTLDGYRVFGDDLEVDNEVSDLDPTNRVVFSAGYINARHYTIDFSGGVVFNYAVDASWEPPQGDEPYTPDNFPPEANRPEAWAISVTELDNTLWHAGGTGGGNLSLMIDVWDHYNADQNTLWVDSPGKFTPVFVSTPVGGGDGYSTYEVDILGATPDAGTLDILVGIESEESDYWGVLPGEPLTGYFLYSAEVAGESIVLTSPNGGEEWTAEEHHNITWDTNGDIAYVDLFYSKDDFVGDVHEIISDYANSGIYDWLVPEDPSETVKVRVVKSGGGLSDDSDDFFTILPSGCNFGTDGFALAQMYTYLVGSYPWMGVLATRKDATQRIVMRSSDNVNTSVLIYNASNPSAGPIASYATGDLIYCNNDQAMWIDSLTITGADRIFYNNFGTGSPMPGYQLKSIDWNGSEFVNPQTLTKASMNGIWNLCVTPDGDLIIKDAQAYNPTFYLYDKSNNYATSFLFQLSLSDFNYVNSGYFREIAYNEELDAIMIFCLNEDESLGGQLFVVDMSGDLIFEDDEIFEVDPANHLAWNVGIDIDLADPECRVVLYADEVDSTNQSVVWRFARYSADLEEKEVYQVTSSYYGPCRGDLQADGILWAVPHSGYQHLFKFNPPPDW